MMRACLRRMERPACVEFGGAAVREDEKELTWPWPRRCPLHGTLTKEFLVCDETVAAQDETLCRRVVPTILSVQLAPDA
jgi:hypothetical protein